MWQVTDQTEATSFMAELLQCRNCAQHFIVYERQKFSKLSVKVYVSPPDLIYFKKELNILRVANRCFGHLPVVGMPDPDSG